MNHIEIGGVQHPLLFNMNAIKNVMQVAGMENFNDLTIERDLGKSMDFALSCAFYGILEGYEDQDKETPFKSPTKLGAKIKRFTELSPALDAFTQAATDFFSSDEPEGK
jgi:hypothetical protein